MNDNIEDKSKKVKRLRRGIHLLPSMLTVSSMFLGFYSIIASQQGRVTVACWAILVAMIFDSLDGRVARMTNTQSEFGAQLDSLADLVSFGLAPAFLVYFWQFVHYGKLGWLVSFVIMTCTALRLARFNSSSEQENKRYFRGLPCPFAATIITAMIWGCYQYGFSSDTFVYASMIVCVFIALLMVSTIRYRSFKDFDLRKNVSFYVILAFVFLLTLLVCWPIIVLFSTTFVYALARPVMVIYRIFFRSK